MSSLDGAIKTFETDYRQFKLSTQFPTFGVDFDWKSG